MKLHFFLSVFLKSYKRIVIKEPEASEELHLQFPFLLSIKPIPLILV